MSHQPDPWISPDGLWRWTGSAWVPAAAASSRWQIRDLDWPRWLIALATLWALALIAWVPVAGIVHSAAGSAAALAWALGASGAAAAVFTAIVGFVLGRRSWWRHGVIALGFGTAVVLGSYVAAMVAFSNPSDPSADNAAGAGLVILTVPTALALASILGLGGAVGRLLRQRPNVRSDGYGDAETGRS